MSMSSLIAVPAAIVLVLASTATAAQDKQNLPTVSKPVTTLSKATKQKPVAAPQDATAKSVKHGTEKETTPSATQSKPISERSYEGCEHSTSSDA